MTLNIAEWVNMFLNYFRSILSKNPGFLEPDCVCSKWTNSLFLNIDVHPCGLQAQTRCGDSQGIYPLDCHLSDDPQTNDVHSTKLRTRGAGSVLGQRRRRWPSTEPAPAKHSVIAGKTLSSALVWLRKPKPRSAPVTARL